MFHPLFLSDDIVRERLLSVSRPMLLSFSARLPLNHSSRITHRKEDLVDSVLHAFRGDRSCIMSLSHRDIQFLCSFYEPFDGVSAPSLSVLSRASLTGEYFLRKYGPDFFTRISTTPTETPEGTSCRPPDDVLTPTRPSRNAASSSKKRPLVDHADKTLKASPTKIPRVTESEGRT